MAPDDIEDQKRVELYASTVDAWFNTSLERDKNVLALSAGGIGLLMTLVTTVGVTSAEALVLYLCALVCFAVALVAVLAILSGNRRHIEDVVSGRVSSPDSRLDMLDSVAIWAFGLGAIFAAIIGIAAAIHSYKEKSMANESLTKVNVPVDLTKSFSGMTNLQPSAPAPAAPSASQGQGGATAPAAAPAANPQGQVTGK